MEKTTNFISDRISLFGRTNTENGSLLLGWTGSGFAYSFFGTETRIKFGKFNSERHFYFQISVDGRKETHCICTSDQIIVIRGLPLKAHNIKVTKITECMQKAEVKEIVICGETIGFLDPPVLPDLRFEFIGDSLTAGFGNMSEPDANEYRASEQDLTYGYSYLTATKFRADGRYICCSGKGIFNNWDGSKENRITDFYDKTYIGEEALHDFSTWQPHVIFINAGTNDITAKTDPKDFKEAYISFVKKVHSLNPKSYIVCIHNVTTDAFSKTFKEIEKEFKKDPKSFYATIEFVKFVPVTEDLYGALGHPNSSAHARLAREILRPIKRIIHKGTYIE